MHSTGESSKWHLFLDSLYNTFSEYEIQSEINKFNVANLEDWGKSGKSQGITITKNTLKVFLNLISQYNITPYDDVNVVKITNPQLEELNNVLRVTLKHGITKSCSTTNDLFIKGYYVKLSDLLKSDGTFNLHSECEYMKSINVFALNTIFIDRDIRQRDPKISISIISPKWKVVGKGTINLNGIDGESYNNSAQKAWGRSQKGHDGEPGKPGGPGGNFFGIGEQFIGGSNLSITANGGNGGKGQEGGSGSNGKDGTHPFLKTDQLPCYEELCKTNRRVRGLHHIFNCSQLLYSSSPSGMVRNCKIRVFGIPGDRGGDGGNGGNGGKGGDPGNIVLVELNSVPVISKSSRSGDDGAGGLGGAGGEGGINGDDVYMSYETYDNWYSMTVIFNERRSKSGEKGIDGSTKLSYPKAAVASFQPAKVINEYKHYVLENLNEPLLNSSLSQFLKQINNNIEVKSLYNTLELANELNIIEANFNKLNKITNLIPIYQSLMNRVSEYARNPKDNEHSNEHKKILSYLYSAIVSKIYNLRSNSETNLIININEHLDMVINDIETLKNMQEVKNKVDIIRKYKESYKNGVDRKIEDATFIIDSRIMPEMIKIFSGINNQIELLINDTVALQEKANEEKERLLKKRHELEKALELRGLFSGLKIVGQVMSFLGPMGAVAGSVIGLAGITSEYLTLDKEINQEPLLKLPPSVTTNLRTLADQFKNAKHRKIVNLNRLIEEVIQQMNKCPEKLSNTSVKITDIKDRLKSINTNDLDGIRMLEDELKRELKIKELELKTQKIEADQRTANALSVIEKCNLISQFAILGFDVYNKYKTDEAKLSAITISINQSLENFQKLKEYEKIIDNIIFPMVENLEDSIFDITSKLGSKSKVYLDITKWKVQDSLKNIKKQMRKLTEGFEERDEILHYVEKLEDMMTTLITVYDRIQNFNEQQNLVNYITDISSTAANNIDISNSALNDIRNDLEILIRSNLVLRQYNTAIEAFKKFVFPLAHLYLKELMQPSHLHSEMSLNNLVYESVRHIKNLKSKIQEYKTYVNGSGYNPYVMVGEFNSQNFSTEPFFVWKNEEYNDEISNLLSGKKILITADVKRSSSYEDAIKFRIAEFHFKSQNSTIQSQIDNIFRGFEVVATHLGNSYYKCGDKIYVIPSNLTTISYYLEKKPDGQPIRKSVTYVDIKNSDLILSPYATWEVVLMESTRKISFSDLEIYKNKLDLELIGEGSYFDNRRVNFSEMMIDEYYESIGEENKQKKESSSQLPKYSQSARTKRHIIRQTESKTHKSNSNINLPSRNISIEFKNLISWNNLPSFVNFPGAERSPMQKKKCHRAKHIFSKLYAVLANKNYHKELENSHVVDKVKNKANIFVHFVTIPYQKTMEFLKNFSISGRNINTRFSYNKSSLQHTEYIAAENSSYLSNNLELSCGYKNDNVLTATDFISNLTLAWLVVHKIYGPNKTLNNTYYVSPQQYRRRRINDLEKEIIPTLKRNYEDNNFRDFLENDSQSWYEELDIC